MKMSSSKSFLDTEKEPPEAGNIFQTNLICTWYL